MKKTLMATTGIVAAVAAFAMVASVPTMAAEKKAAEKKPAVPLKIGISGAYESWFGFVDEDNDAANGIGGTTDLDLKTDHEIHFSGSTTLDNGLSVKVKFEMEADAGAGTHADESHVTISGAFGSLTLGEEDPVTTLNSLHGSMGGMGLGDGNTWVREPTGYGDFLDTVWLDLGFGDNHKINYSTPSINGLQVGLTWTPVGDDSAAGSTLESGADHNGIGVSLVYKGTFGAKDSGNAINLAVNYMEGENPDDESLAAADMTGYMIGGSVTSGNVTVGVGYLEEKNVGATSVATERTNRTYDIMASYAAGPASYSIGFMSGTHDQTSVGDSFDVIQIAYNLDLSAGVTWASTFGKSEFDGNGTGGAEDNEGVYLVTGIKVAF